MTIFAGEGVFIRMRGTGLGLEYCTQWHSQTFKALKKKAGRVWANPTPGGMVFHRKRSGHHMEATDISTNSKSHCPCSDRKIIKLLMLVGLWMKRNRPMPVMVAMNFWTVSYLTSMEARLKSPRTISLRNSITNSFMETRSMCREVAIQ